MSGEQGAASGARGPDGRRADGSGDDLPRLLQIADGFASGRPGQSAREVCERTVSLVRAGVSWVMLRDHAASEPAFAEAAGRLAGVLLAERPGVRLTVNTRLPVALDLRASLHVGHRGPGVRDALAAGVREVGVSAHAAADLAEAARDGAAYATLSPVFPTRTHPEASPLGLDAFATLVASARLPVLALGGLTPERARAARLAGAHGVAVLAGLLDAPDPADAVASFLVAAGGS